MDADDTERLTGFRALVRTVLPGTMLAADTDIDRALRSVLGDLPFADIHPDRLGPLADVVAVRVRRHQPL